MKEAKTHIDGMLLGFLFDFVSWLTVRDVTVKFGKKHEVPKAIELVTQFIDERKLKDKMINTNWEDVREDLIKLVEGESDGEDT